MSCLCDYDPPTHELLREIVRNVRPMYVLRDGSWRIDPEVIEVIRRGAHENKVRRD